jgi:hypothetical protein
MLVMAHIAGVPVEEMLPWAVPLGGFGIAGVVAWGGGLARAARRRAG